MLNLKGVNVIYIRRIYNWILSITSHADKNPKINTPEIIPREVTPIDLRFEDKK